MAGTAFGELHKKIEKALEVAQIKLAAASAAAHPDVADRRRREAVGIATLRAKLPRNERKSDLDLSLEIQAQLLGHERANFDALLRDAAAAREAVSDLIQAADDAARWLAMPDPARLERGDQYYTKLDENTLVEMRRTNYFLQRLDLTMTFRDATLSDRYTALARFEAQDDVLAAAWLERSIREDLDRPLTFSGRDGAEIREKLVEERRFVKEQLIARAANRLSQDQRTALATWKQAADELKAGVDHLKLLQTVADTAGVPLAAMPPAPTEARGAHLV